MKKKFLIGISLIIGLFIFTASCYASSSELEFAKNKSGDEIVLTTGTSAKAMYLVFNETPSEYTVEGNTVENFYFLQQYIELDGNMTVTIKGADPAEIYLFDGTDIPDWVHIWQAPCEKADLLLFSSHADDEQLFFAGLLPYYTKVRGLEVQVVYMTDHLSQLSRHQERLNGLYAVGIRHYPVSSGYNDLYSESYEQALNNLIPYGVSEDDIIKFEKDTINRFQPQLIVTHDINGEYGHGMHRLVNGTLQKALKDAETEFSFLRKVYFHLYDQNQISFDLIDEPFDELDGMTPFEVTQKYGFAAHESQHWTWFKGWIYGKSNQITKASEITTYSPLKYGLWYSAVGLDEVKNDLFEHLESYADQEEQRLALEAEAKAAEEALRKAEELQVLLDAEARKQKIIMASIGFAIIIIILCIIIVQSQKKSMKYKGKH